MFSTFDAVPITLGPCCKKCFTDYVLPRREEYEEFLAEERFIAINAMKREPMYAKEVA